MPESRGRRKHEPGHGLDGLLEAPALDEQPDHEDGFAHNGDRQDTKIGVRCDIQPQYVTDVCECRDGHQHSVYRRHVSRAEHQKGAQKQYEAEDDQRETPVVPVGTEQQVDLFMQAIRAKRDRIFR